MTPTPTAYDATTARPLRPTALRATAVLALVGGSALVVDVVTITVLNRSFGALDDLLFLVGFVGMLLACAAFATYVGAGARRRRVGVGVVAFLGVGVALGAVSAVADAVGRHVFSPANVGLHTEWSFFSIGLCLLVLAGWAATRPR